MPIQIRCWQPSITSLSESAGSQPNEALLRKWSQMLPGGRRKPDRIPVHPGDVLVVPPNTPHSYGADDQAPWTQLWFHATGSRVARFLAQLKVAGGPQRGRITKLEVVKQSVY